MKFFFDPRYAPHGGKASTGCVSLVYRSAEVGYTHRTCIDAVAIRPMIDVTESLCWLVISIEHFFMRQIHKSYVDP